MENQGLELCLTPLLGQEPRKCLFSCLYQRLRNFPLLTVAILPAADSHVLEHMPLAPLAFPPSLGWSPDVMTFLSFAFCCVV